MLSIEKMPTAISADKHPIHNWFNFVAGYSPEYVVKVIEDFEKKMVIVPGKYMTHLQDVEPQA